MEVFVVAKPRRLEDPDYSRTLDTLEQVSGLRASKIDSDGIRTYRVGAPTPGAAARHLGAMLDSAHLSEWPEHMTFEASSSRG